MNAGYKSLCMETAMFTLTETLFSVLVLA